MTTNMADTTQDAAAETEAPKEPSAAPPPPVPTIGRDAGGIKLSTLEDCVRYARYICASKFCPYSKKHGKMTVEDAVVCLQAGAELGLSPMQSVSGIAPINGRATIWGDAMLAVCFSARVFDHKRFSERLDGSGDASVAVCMCARIGAPPVVRRFSVADARKAKLWTKDGPWQEHPMRMLQMRARAFALRDTFADVLKGMQCREEMLDVSETINMLDIPATPSAIREGLSKPTEPPKAEAKATTDARAADLEFIEASTQQISGQRFNEILQDMGIDYGELTLTSPAKVAALAKRVREEMELTKAQAANGPTDGAAVAT